MRHGHLSAAGTRMPLAPPRIAPAVAALDTGAVLSDEVVLTLLMGL